MIKTYNLYIDNASIKNALKAFLIELKIIFDISGCGGGYYISLNASIKQAEKINNYLDTLYLI